MAQWEVVVGNVGTVFSGTNGAEAMREYGRSKDSANTQGGRDGGEIVTLFRDGEIHHEHTPGPFFFVEITDTFGGEANYSWVTRHKVRASSERGALIRMNRESGLGFRSVGCNRYDSRSGATCAFFDAWDEEQHGQLQNVCTTLA